MVDLKISSNTAIGVQGPSHRPFKKHGFVFHSTSRVLGPASLKRKAHVGMLTRFHNLRRTRQNIVCTYNVA